LTIVSHNRPIISCCDDKKNFKFAGYNVESFCPYRLTFSAMDECWRATSQGKIKNPAIMWWCDKGHNCSSNLGDNQSVVIKLQIIIQYPAAKYIDGRFEKPIFIAVPNVPKHCQSGYHRSMAVLISSVPTFCENCCCMSHVGSKQWMIHRYAAIQYAHTRTICIWRRRDREVVLCSLCCMHRIKIRDRG